MIDLHALGSRLYFDTNIYIYGLEAFPEFQDRVNALFEYADQPETRIYASRLLFLELLPKPIAQNNEEIAQSYINLLENGENIRLVECDQAVINQATKLRASYNLKSLDALHLATAILYDCESFITQDQALKKVQELNILTLDDF